MAAICCWNRGSRFSVILSGLVLVWVWWVGVNLCIWCSLVGISVSSSSLMMIVASSMRWCWMVFGSVVCVVAILFVVGGVGFVGLFMICFGFVRCRDLGRLFGFCCGWFF